MLLKKIIATILSSAFALSPITTIAFADNIDHSFVPDNMMNENSIPPEEFTELTGIRLLKLDDKNTASSMSADPNFVPDDMMNENSISPEEFTELTGIRLTKIGADEALRLRSQKVSTMSSESYKLQLTWDTTKPYKNDLWDWAIVYNLNDYSVDSAYTAYATSNTFSQEALEASAYHNILLTMTPNDNKSDIVRVYVHIVDNTTKAETTFDAFILANASDNYIIENPKNRNMNIVMNLSNSSYSTRTGRITMDSL